MNQAVFVTYGEEALDAWFRDRLGLDENRIWDYVAAKTTIEYRSALRIADGPAVATVELVRLGTKSVTTRTTISELTMDERAEELARMLGGLEVTGKAREHAREMLNLAGNPDPKARSGKRKA